MNPTELSRRGFVRTTVIAGAAAMLAPRLAPLARATGTPTGRAALGGHRNLFNGDCNFLFYNPELWQPEGGPYRAGAIHRFVDLLAASGIDTLLVNPATQVAWYPTKELEYVLRGYRRGDRGFVLPIARGNAGLSAAQVEAYADQLVRLCDLYLDLTEAGVDWLAECATACRQRGLSPWLSYRMNATHFSGAPDSPANCRLFRDPANRLSGRIPGATPATSATWTGLDYGRPAVRDHMFALIREGVTAYDYEGLELDWLRHPLCLEAGATARQTDEITAWLADVKAMAGAHRPTIPLGLRLPGNLAYLRDIGLDVPALVRRGVVDFVTFSNFWQSAWEMPLDELRRRLGPDVAIYGGMEDAPNWLEAFAPGLTQRPTGPEIQLAGDHAFKAAPGSTGAARVRGTRYLSASAPLLRGNAAGKLVLGADGLEQFNFFVTDQVRVPGQRGDYAALRRLADLDFLRGQEKHYALNTASTQATKLWDVPEQLPVRLAPGHRRALRIPLCAEPADAGLELVVQLITTRGQPGPQCGVSLNGSWPRFGGRATRDLLFPAGPYQQHVEEHDAWNLPFAVDVIRDGWNEIVVSNESTADVDLVAVELAVIRRRS